MNPHRLLKEDKQIRAVESIRRVDEAGHLYYMESDWNYYDLEEPFAAMLDAGCSTFALRNTAGQFLMYRNYDYRHYRNNDKTQPLTGINVICRNQNPAAKYKSIGVADAYWLDFKNGSLMEGCADDEQTDLSTFIMIPYICMDGINEAGLAVSIMALSVDEAHKEELVRTTMPGKKAVLHPVLMRLMLDGCASVEEALALADGVNVKAPAPGMDFHIMVADQSGACKVLEWVENQMNIIDTCHSTNYRFSADDAFHGFCPRDEVLKAGLKLGEKYGLPQERGELVLHLASQDHAIGEEIGQTQYSCVYNLQEKTLKVFSFGDFGHSWSYTL